MSEWNLVVFGCRRRGGGGDAGRGGAERLFGALEECFAARDELAAFTVELHGAFELDALAFEFGDDLGEPRERGLKRGRFVFRHRSLPLRRARRALRERPRSAAASPAEPRRDRRAAPRPDPERWRSRGAAARAGRRSRAAPAAPRSGGARAGPRARTSVPAVRRGRRGARASRRGSAGRAARAASRSVRDPWLPSPRANGAPASVPPRRRGRAVGSAASSRRNGRWS